LPQQPRSFVDYLDDGTAIAVQIRFPQPGRVAIDFEGTGPVSATNFNANPSIVTAAVMYVLRCMIADELPLNEGVLRCVELKVPRGILNPSPNENCEESPAVAAGNVETSQRVVDVLLGAFGIAAASQGTMNNVLFGNQRFGFYETICGGAGAIEGLDGASGVHTHMTNTRLTDPEILESRYPVRLLQFGLRTKSGGTGRWRGGDGIVREFQFLEAVELSLLTSRRGPYLPYGMAGGFAGSAGQNTLLKNSGERLKLDNCCHLELAANDRLQIETPGGGGFG
jgi:5-oxoprolinase (ATP-hydrolysing)